MKERQKQARPLPARLQAATDRLAKAKAANDEANTKVMKSEEQLAQDLKVQTETAARVAEAEAELQAVTELAAVGSSQAMACTMANIVANLSGGNGLALDPKVIEDMKLQILHHFYAAIGGQLPPGMGQQAAAAAAKQAPAAGSQAAGVAAVTMAQQTAAATAAEAAQLQAAATAAARASAAVAAAVAAGQQQAAAELAAAAAGTQAAAAAAALPASLAAPGTPVGALLQGRRPTRSHSPGRGRNSLLLAAA